jgi:hypothetical protein
MTSFIRSTGLGQAVEGNCHTQAKQRRKALRNGLTTIERSPISLRAGSTEIVISAQSRQLGAQRL